MLKIMLKAPRLSGIFNWLDVLAHKAGYKTRNTSTGTCRDRQQKSVIVQVTLYDAQQPSSIRNFLFKRGEST